MREQRLESCPNRWSRIIVGRATAFGAAIAHRTTRIVAE